MEKEISMKRTTFVGLALLLILTTVAPLRAAVSDFSWTVDNLSVSGGVITNPTGTGYGMANGTFDTDYTVTATCIMRSSTTGGYWCGVQARQNGAAPSVADTQAYMFLIGGSHGQQELALHRLAGGTSAIELDSAAFNYQLGVEYVLSLTVEGSTITGCLEGGPCLTANDSVLTSGTAGVGVRRSTSNNISPEVVDFTYDGEVSKGYDGTFIDDDGNVHEGMIEAIAAIGVTQGCSASAPQFYCPFDPVTRGQMASFIARALGLPAAAQDWFDDDDGTTHEDNINRLAEADITLGCGPATSFCPDDLVTRAQMASFLARAFDLPVSATDWFDDDDGTTHEDNINALADAAITLGCDPADPTLYCPNESVQRDQMASFLGRALGLDPIFPG